MVQHRQGGEILPDKSLAVRWTFTDVRSEQSPGPGLRDSGLEPDGHGEQACELAEDQLLARFCGDGLIEELCAFARIEMCLESPDTGFTEASQLLGEVESFMDGLKRVIVSAWSSLISGNMEWADEERTYIVALRRRGLRVNWRA